MQEAKLSVQVCLTSTPKKTRECKKKRAEEEDEEEEDCRCLKARLCSMLIRIQALFVFDSKRKETRTHELITLMKENTAAAAAEAAARSTRKLRTLDVHPYSTEKGTFADHSPS